MDLEEQVFEDILINIKRFETIRFFRNDHVEEIEPRSKEDKNTIHTWPNKYALKRFHKRNYDEFREYLQEKRVNILPNEFMFVYLLEEPEFSRYYSTKNNVDYLRFRHIRNYFVIKRLQHWQRRGKEITLELLNSIDISDKFDDLKISNSELMAYIMDEPSRDNFTWIIRERTNRSKFMILGYTQLELIFHELKLFHDTPIEILLETDLNIPNKEMGYVMNSDKELYEKIVNRSYINFSKLVDDPVMLSKTKQHYTNFCV